MMSLAHDDQSERLAAGDRSRIAIARVGQVPLVGRVAELAQLERELSTAFAGEPRALFLAGEAGIGKSRLLDEACGLARVRDRSAAVLLGRCLDERGMPPFLPWLDAGSSVGPDDFPNRRTLRSILGDGDEPTIGSPSISPERRKLLLFDAVTKTLSELAGVRPVLLAFDDLQWSDAASNELLRYLVLHCPTVPLMIVGAYRIEESSANPALMRTVEELDRRRLLTVLRVGPLDAPATARLVGHLLPRRCDPALATRIHEHCDGNPFYIEEVVRTLRDEAGALSDQVAGADPHAASDDRGLPLPSGVSAIVARRLDRVSQPCRAVLEVAALIGQQIPVDLLALASEREPIVVAEMLEEAARAGIVRALGPDKTNRIDALFAPDFAFLHDRVRETIARTVNPVRQRVLHGRIAAAIRDSPGAEDDLHRLSALTHHYLLARDSPAAAGAATRLGAAALCAHAYAEAAAAIRIAADLVAEGARDPALPSAAELRFRLGEAALAAGIPDAIDAFAAAEVEFAAQGDTVGVARARRHLGAAHARREEFDLAVAYLEGSLAQLAEAAVGDDSELEQERAEVLVELGSISGLSLGRYDEAIAAGRQALALARRHARATPALEARSRLALANTLMRAGRLAEGYALLPEALTRALGANDPNLAAEAAGALANYHYWVGDLDASERAALRRRDLADRGGDPYTQRHVAPWLAFLATARGRWDDAERLVSEAEAAVGRVASPEPQAFLRKIAGFSLLYRGHYSDAVVALEEAIAGFRPSGPGTVAWYLGCLATAYFAAGDPASSDRAAAEVADLIAALPPTALPRAPALAELGLIAARRQDVTAARRWYRELQCFSGQLHWVATDRILGMLAAVLGDHAAAERHFAAALTLTQRGGVRPELALTLAERGVALRRLADSARRDAAVSVLRQSVEQLTALGMAGDAARVATHLRASATSGAPAADLPAGLTEREAEVLTLVAQGLTNREIGARLGISDKTVTNHLTHVFTKANLENRSAAVAFAIRQGLA